MNFSYNDLVSINEIKADALQELGDKNERKLTPGYYRAQIKYALDELSFDTFFLPVVKDIEIPDDLKVEIPKGCFNITNMQIYTGTPDDIGYVENVYWKRHMRTRGYDTGYVSNRTAGHHVYDPWMSVRTDTFGLYFFNVSRGIIYLSDSCNGFDYLQIEFDGLASSELDIDMIKIVPPMVRKAVTLWVVEKCARALKYEDNRYSKLQADAAAQLDEYGVNGAWAEAKRRLAKVDKKLMRDFMEYNAVNK